MRASLTQFSDGLSALRRYIAGLELEARLLAIEADDGCPDGVKELLGQLREQSANSVSKRRFDYNSVIVSLYGFVEQFIEATIRAYLRRLNQLVPKYEDLPPQVVNAHVQASFELILRAEQTRYQGEITAAQVVSNLSSCLRGLGPYEVNVEAFVHHTANFRREVVDATFSKVGVQNVAQRILHTAVFREYLARLSPDREIEGISLDDAFAPLDNLAERRNEVSHGTPSEVLAYDILLTFLEFFEAYGPALSEVVSSDLFAFEAKYLGTELGEPIMVINNEIVCIELRDTGVRVGDSLLARTGDRSRPFVGGSILEIQIDKEGYAEVPARPSVKVGMRVDFKTKENHSFYLVPRQPSPSVQLELDNATEMETIVELGANEFELSAGDAGDREPRDAGGDVSAEPEVADSEG